jgi:hypothetical protein
LLRIFQGSGSTSEPYASLSVIREYWYNSPEMTPPAEEDSPVKSRLDAETSAITAGQRRVNLIWEYTQAAIAIFITLATVVESIAVTFAGKGEMAIPNILCVGFGLVVGTYFQRTNHIKIGGVGSKVPGEDR